MDAAGNFVVIWVSDLQDDGASYGVYGQRYDASGAAQGAEFRVNTTIVNSQLYHDVAMLADGRFVVAYQSRNADGSFEVYLQRYAADGSALGGETRVNTSTVSSAQQPIASISADPSGNLTVVWNSAADGSGTGVVGRRFDWSGTALGGEFQVNTTSAGNQLYPEVVAQPGGGFIVAWGGNGSGDADGVFMQRYGLTTTEAGGTATFSVVLEAAPTGNVVIPISVPDGTEGSVVVGSLTFTTANWNVAQTVTVTGVQDYTNDGNVVYTVVLGAATSTDANFNGLNPADVSVTNLEVPNVAPVNAVPGDQFTDEDTALVFSAANGNAISISDADAGSGIVNVLLSATNGTITLNGTAGLSFISGDGTGDALLNFTGTIAGINAALNGLVFTPTADFSGAASLQIVIGDMGNSGTGGSLADSDAVTITVNSVNDTPNATNLSAAESYSEDTPLNLTDIVISDVDSASVTATLTLSNAAAGSLNTATSGAVTSTYNAGSGVWSASGALADVNTLLAGLTFTPAADFNANFSIATSVSDGSLSVGGSKAMTGSALNDAPSATNLSAAEAYTEDTALNLTDIVISDVDSANVIATLTLSNTAAGSLNTGTSGAVTSTYNAGTGVWTASGALADVNTLLAGLSFTPAANFNSAFSIATSISDGVAAPVTGSKAMTGTAVNDAPSATNLSAAETYTEDTALNLTDIVISDVDSASVTAMLTLSSAAAGSLNTGTSGAVTSTYNAGTGVWSASGAVADVNTLLAGLIFAPAANFNSNFTIATSVSDGVAAPVTGSKAMTGTAVNDAPSATNLSAAETYTEDTLLNLTDIVVSDVDSANVTATLTLSNVAAGSLSTGTSGAVTSTYNAGTGIWTASGAIADVNALLAGLTFTPAANFNANFTISTSVSDGVAAPVTGSKAMTGTAVNDAPTATNLSAAETYTEDNALNLTDIVISDVDSANVTATLTLSSAAAGSLNTGTSGAVTSTYNAGTGVWTASGAVADVNTLLAGLTFTPAANFNSAFSIATSVSDGVAAPITGSKAMTGTAVNDAPSATNLSAAETYTEDTALNLTDIVISDVDSANVTATLTLSNTAAGSLNTGTSGAVTSTYNAGTGVWSRQRRDRRCQHVARRPGFYPGRRLQQRLQHRHQHQRRCGRSRHRQQGDDRDRGQRRAERNQPQCGRDLHRGHRAEPDRHRDQRRRQCQRHGDVDLVERRRRQFEHRHLGCCDLDLQRRHRGVERQRRGRRCQHVARRPDLCPGGQLQQQLHDRDERQRRRGRSRHRQQGDDRARLSTTRLVEPTSVPPRPTPRHAAEPDRHPWSATSTAPTHRTLTFTPAANFNANFTISTSVSDGVAAPVTGTKAMTGTAVNDAPTATNLSAAETYTEDNALNLTDIVVSDVDSANVTATLTLSNAAAGSLNTGTSGAVTSTYNAGTGVWTASGAIADVNTLLAGLTFTPAANFNSTFTIATSVSDGVAAPITGSKAMTGTAVNDAPSATNLSAADLHRRHRAEPDRHRDQRCRQCQRHRDPDFVEHGRRQLEHRHLGCRDLDLQRRHGCLDRQRRGRRCQHVARRPALPPRPTESTRSRDRPTQLHGRSADWPHRYEVAHQHGGDSDRPGHERQRPDRGRRGSYIRPAHLIPTSWSGATVDSASCHGDRVTLSNAAGSLEHRPPRVLVTSTYNASTARSASPRTASRAPAFERELDATVGSGITVRAWIYPGRQQRQLHHFDQRQRRCRCPGHRQQGDDGHSGQRRPYRDQPERRRDLHRRHALNLTDIVVSDVDSANVTATLTLSNAAAGSLNTGTSGAVTSTYNAGTGVWTASGAIADVNTLLAGLTFTPAANFNSNFTSPPASATVWPLRSPAARR